MCSAGIRKTFAKTGGAPLLSLESFGGLAVEPPRDQLVRNRQDAQQRQTPRLRMCSADVRNTSAQAGGAPLALLASSSALAVEPSRDHFSALLNSVETAKPPNNAELRD